jgi:hypothetical protein
MSEFTIVSTSKSRLIDFLKQGMGMWGVEESDRGHIRVSLSHAFPDEFCLVTPDPDELDVYHVVFMNGSVVCRGIEALGYMLIGLGAVDAEWGGNKQLNQRDFSLRMAKARRVMHNDAQLVPRSTLTEACITALKEES